MINAQNSGRFKKGQQISVFDKNKNETTIYDSIREAARVLDIPNSSIRRNLKTGSLYKFRYIFNKV
jgi:group I intron endonuclease